MNNKYNFFFQDGLQYEHDHNVYVLTDVLSEIKITDAERKFIREISHFDQHTVATLAAMIMELKNKLGCSAVGENQEWLMRYRKDNAKYKIPNRIMYSGESDTYTSLLAAEYSE